MEKQNTIGTTRNSANIALFLVGPSGSGKTTTERLFAEYVKTHPEELGRFQRIISYTTREPRREEEEAIRAGKEPAYFFLDTEQFEKKIDNEEFLEYEKHADCYKGNTKEEWEKKLREGNVYFSYFKNSLSEITKKLESLEVEVKPCIVFFDISEEECFNRLITRYAEDIKIPVVKLGESVRRKDSKYNSILSDLAFRLKDIHYLSSVKEEADIVISVAGKTPEDIVAELIGALKSWKK